MLLKNWTPLIIVHHQKEKVDINIFTRVCLHVCLLKRSLAVFYFIIFYCILQIFV